MALKKLRFSWPQVACRRCGAAARRECPVFVVQVCLQNERGTLHGWGHATPEELLGAGAQASLAV